MKARRSKWLPIGIGVFVGATSPIGAQSPLVPVLHQRTGDVEDSVLATSRSITIPFGVEEIQDEAVRFTASFSQNGSTVTRNLDFLLFKNITTVTTANLLKYVDDGDYVGSMIHRNVPGFVIQGGGFTVADAAGGGISFGSVPTDAPIVNEFAISNTLGTLSMAKTATGPDTATSQWFVSTNTNNDNLDLQNGGFTVFGRVSKDTLNNALDLNNLVGFFQANFGGAFSSVPLVQGTTQATLDQTDFYRFSSITRIPLPPGQAGSDSTLSYRIGVADGSESIQGALVGNVLNLTYQNPQRGDSKRFRIEAEDSIGNIVEDEFEVNITATYEQWRQTFFNASDASDNSISGPYADPDGDGISNAMIYTLGLDILGSEADFLSITTSPTNTFFRLAYPVQGGLLTTFPIDVEVSTDLAGGWNPLPPERKGSNSSEGQFVVLPKDPPVNREFFRIVINEQ